MHIGRPSIWGQGVTTDSKLHESRNDGSGLPGRGGAESKDLGERIER